MADDQDDDGLAREGVDAAKLTRVGFGAALIGSARAGNPPVPGVVAEESASTLAHSDTQPNFERQRSLGKQHTIVTPRLGGAAAAAAAAVVSVIPTPAPAPPTPERTRLRLVAGKIVPGTRYRLVRWLGEGGMGVVYEAEHEDIERRVALKILRFDLSQQPEMPPRFPRRGPRRQPHGLANIVEIFDFGELPDGRLMFCMELLDGKDLVTELDNCPLPRPRSSAILRQLCKGLAAAHQHGIVHRDIKPENIILREARRPRTAAWSSSSTSASPRCSRADTGADRIPGTPHTWPPSRSSASPSTAASTCTPSAASPTSCSPASPPFPGDRRRGPAGPARAPAVPPAQL
jgi:hypothetical protein